MCAPDPASYPLLGDLLNVLLGSPHATRLGAVAGAVWALLQAQSLHPADLARAWPELRAAKARQGLRRVRRLLGRTVLRGEGVTPWLLPAVLRLVADAEVLLVLDSTRCRRWEVFTLGVRVRGRVFPVAWSVLPYPWPRKRFTPTVVALLERVFALWPPDRPLALVAARGFPSLKLFRCLERGRQHLPLEFAIRLRAGDYVRLADGRPAKLADLERAVPAGAWTARPAAYQHRGKAGAPAWLVVGRGEPQPPAHQRGPADHARRSRRAARRVAHVLSKGQPRAPQTDRAWALLSSAPGPDLAVARYGGRFSTEGTYRDLKSWGLEGVAAHEADPVHLDGLLGLAALAYLVQAALGAAAGRTDEESARARQRQWSTADRLSDFWRGRQVLQDRAHDWRPWTRLALAALTQALRPLPRAAPALARALPPPRHKEAA
jgi:hypothetical protein